MSELKPCPFCGGEAIARPSVVCDQGLYVYCKDHTCQGWTVSRCPPVRWNTRATPTLSDVRELPEVKALVAAVELLGLRRLVAGWNGEGLETPYTPHEPKLGVRLSVTAGTVYAIDAALAAFKEPKL